MIERATRCEQHLKSAQPAKDQPQRRPFHWHMCPLWQGGFACKRLVADQQANDGKDEIKTDPCPNMRGLSGDEAVIETIKG